MRDSALRRLAAMGCTGLVGDRAVGLRNFLGRQFFRQRSAAFMTEAGRDHMIEELQAACDFFKRVDDELEPASYLVSRLGPARRSRGIPPLARRWCEWSPLVTVGASDCPERPGRSLPRLVAPPRPR